MSFATKRTTLLLPLALIISVNLLIAQVDNDDCETAIAIGDVSDFCSDIDLLTNVDATASPFGVPNCFTNAAEDVWFTFLATANDLSVVVNGASGNGAGGTMLGPAIELYTGSCSNLSVLDCVSDPGGRNLVELREAGLVVGARYFIRIDGNSDGTFQLCIRNFQAPVDPGQDCGTAAVLCDTSPFVVERVQGAGNEPDEASNSCLGVIAGISSESQSTWFKWEAANDGMLEFTLTPLNSNDDIDFVLYELPGGIDDCNSKQVIRCMGTACLGPTGLSTNSTDTEEDFDCDFGEDGFVSAVQMVPGRAYALLVNNFNNSGAGFSFEFGGSAVLTGPTPDFEIDPATDISCNQPVTITDQSTFDNGSIINYSWGFGLNADRQTANTQGPHDITFNTFGSQFIVLTVESDLGCINSTVKEIEVMSCCDNPDDLQLSAVRSELTSCLDENSGIIELAAMSPSSGGYQYSLNGSAPSENTVFSDLSAGEYLAIVSDGFGCIDSLNVILNAGMDISVNAGPDLELNNSFGRIDATVIPDQPFDVNWVAVNGDSINCIDAECLSIEIAPPGPASYIIEVTSATGCIARDTVNVSVEVSTEINYPNVFSPNDDGINDKFTLYGSDFVQNIDFLEVFDRWGNLVYRGTNLAVNDASSGWDGRLNGEYLQTGVYAFRAEVQVFGQNDTQIISGNITLVR